MTRLDCITLISQSNFKSKFGPVRKSRSVKKEVMQTYRRQSQLSDILNSAYFKKLLPNLRMDTWYLHYDNALAHLANNAQTI